MGKLGLIIKREYLAKVRNKSFIIMTFLSPVLMVAMVVLISFLAKVNDSEKRVISVLNESSYLPWSFETNQSISYVSLRDIDLEQAIDSTRSLGFYGLLHIPDEPSLEQAADSAYLYTKDSPVSFVLEQLEGVFESELRKKRLQDLGLSRSEYLQVDRSFEIRASTFSGEANIKGVSEIKAFIGGGFGYMIMMFIIIYGGFVMRSVIEEKTSRIIEVIISSVKPFQLMLGKIIGTSLAGVTQFAIWIVSASILLLIALLVFGIDPSILVDRSNMSAVSAGMSSDLSPEVFERVRIIGKEVLRIPWVSLLFFFLLYFVLGYLIYSSIYAAIGAAVDNETDTQQFIFPIILPLMLAIYVGFFSVFSNPHGPIAVGFSLFPLTSPIVMLMRLPAGIGENGVPVWQLVVSILLLILTFLAIVWLAAKIYRVGILMYGKKPTYKELWKWLKY